MYVPKTIITARNSNAIESLNATISSKTLLSRVDTFRYLQKDTTYVDFTKDKPLKFQPSPSPSS